jgi:predicted Fe-Mo cluster-binding NifX family protein
MKIAISATGRTLESEVDPRFGRCQYFIIIDAETMRFKVVKNKSKMATGGAGISTARMVTSEGVQAVLTGNCGPNAYRVLSAANIQVVTGVSGNVKDVVQDFKEEKYQPSSQPNVSAHFGTAQRTGMVSSRGRRDTKEELSTLRDQTEALKAQLSTIQSNLEDLNKD